MIRCGFFIILIRLNQQKMFLKIQQISNRLHLRLAFIMLLMISLGTDIASKALDIDNSDTELVDLDDESDTDTENDDLDELLTRMNPFEQFAVHVVDQKKVEVNVTTDEFWDSLSFDIATPPPELV